MPPPLHQAVAHALTAEQIDHLLTHLLRLPDVFAAARPHLLDTHFDLTKEPGPRLLWAAARNVAGQCGPEVLFSDPSAARGLLEVKGHAIAQHSHMVPEYAALVFAGADDF